MLFPRTGSYSPVLDNGEEIVRLFMERQENHNLIKCSLDSLWLLIQFQLGGCDREEHEARFHKKKKREVRGSEGRFSKDQRFSIFNESSVCVCGGGDMLKLHIVNN